MVTPAPSSAADKKSGAAIPEAEFLDNEAARAKAAIAKALGDFKSSLASAADPHRITHEHPWISLGIAAVAGFAATATLVPSKDQQAKRALEELKESLREPAIKAGKEAKSESKPGAPWWSSIVAELVKMIRPLLVGLITSSFGGKADDSADDSSEVSADDVQPAVSSPS